MELLTHVPDVGDLVPVDEHRSPHQQSLSLDEIFDRGIRCLLDTISDLLLTSNHGFDPDPG
jgi:hypothetical protein